MRVEILQPFEVDHATGRTEYAAGEEVANGQRNWVEKGLARELDEPAKAEPAKAETKPTTKSAD